MIDNDQPTVTSSNDSPVEGGEVVILTCKESTNTEVISYQWFKNGVEVREQCDKTFVIGNTREGNGIYSCQVVTAKITSMKSEDKDIIFRCKFNSLLPPQTLTSVIVK